MRRWSSHREWQMCRKRTSPERTAADVPVEGHLPDLQPAQRPQPGLGHAARFLVQRHPTGFVVMY